MDDLEVHECDLFEHERFIVNCLALDERQGVLAIARHSDTSANEREGVIEFWNVIGLPPFHVRTTSLGKKTVESLLWKTDILLASHLDGSVTVHRFHISKYTTNQLSPSPLWCLASVSEHTFCAGSDSGSVFLYSLEDDAHIVPNKTISIGFGTHVISLACNGNVIAAGTIDQICLISVREARIKHTVTLPRIEKRKPTVVWCLCFIGDFLASGDSRGYVTFWNASNGAFSHCLKTHQADVLSMAVSGESLFAAGVDPTIARLAFNQERTAYRVEHQRTVHSNDVRAMVASKYLATLYSGGADDYFCSSNRLKYINGLKPITCSVASGAGIFSYQYTNHIVVWKAGVAGSRISKKGFYALINTPVKLAELRSYKGEFIISSCLNDEGTFLAVSTTHATTLYKLKFETKSESSISVSKRLDICGTKLLFTSGSLFIASGDFQIFVLTIDDTPEKVPSSVAKRDNAGEVMCLHSNSNGSSLSLLTTRNELFILDIREKILRKLQISTTDVLMDAQFINLTSLYILCADRKRTIIEYNTESNVLSSTVISTESLCMLADETVMEINCSDSNGIVLVGSKSSLRIITLIGGKRVLLCGPEACALKMMKAAEGAYSMRRDRCCQASWLSLRKLLFTTPIMLAEPSQTAFRLKRYGQN